MDTTGRSYCIMHRWIKQIDKIQPEKKTMFQHWNKSKDTAIRAPRRDGKGLRVYGEVDYIDDPTKVKGEDLIGSVTPSRRLVCHNFLKGQVTFWKLCLLVVCRALIIPRFTLF